MSKITKKITLWVLSFLFVVCVTILGINVSFTAKAEESPTVVNLTYKSMQYQNNELNAGSYWTSICFYPDTGDGVSTGNPSGSIAADFSDLLAKTTYTGSENTVIYTPACHWGWAMDFKSSTFCFIYLRTVNMPAAGDTVQLKSGAWFVTGGSINDKYVLAEDVNLKFNGTTWEYYVPAVQPEQPDVSEAVPVTFTQINPTWNDNTDILNNGRHYTVLHLSGLQTSGYLGQGDDWSDMLANATINGGASYFNFSAASYIAGPNVASDFIILYSATAPNLNDEFIVKAGATFDVGGDDNNLYQLANDICLKYNGTAWEVFEPSTQPPEQPDEPENPDVPPVQPAETVEITLSSINGLWNNRYYEGQDYYCTFLHLSGEVGGGDLSGDFSDLLSKATLNGQPIDLEDVSFVCAKWIGAEGGILLRFKALPADKSVLVLPADATFTVSAEENKVYKLANTIELKVMNGKWSVPLPTAEFIGVNAWNNNIITISGSRLTILEFNVEKLGDVVNSNKNLVTMAGVSVNGVKLTDIEGASITYAHGAHYMGIDLPLAAIYPTEEYPVTVLKVEEGTSFENYELPEITLSLIGGTWIVGEVEKMPVEEDYVTISDIIGENNADIGTEGMISALDGFDGDVSLKFVYYTEEAIVNNGSYGGLAIYLNTTNLWDGWRIFFIGNKVYVYDATMGGAGDEHVLIGEAEFGIANNFEMQIEISVKKVGETYSIVIGGSCAKILEINDITPIGNCLGGGIMMYSSTRTCSVKDYKYGDVFNPILTIYSKQEIVVEEGAEVPVIDAKAMDGFTEIQPTYVWDEGAITDGKMNAGVWLCVITATDANGNFVTANVRVTVKGEPKYTVTFNGANEVVYAYGEKIEKPTDPTKKATEKYHYVFEGWYNGDEKWDFENDVVTADVALVAKFTQCDVYYEVSVSIAGETQTIYVTYGAQVDLSVFNKDGYVKQVKQNGEVITSLIVTENTAIEVTYTAESNAQGGCGGCNGSLTGISGAIALLGAAGCMLIRKKEKTDEE